jgi:hypothetical protein
VITTKLDVKQVALKKQRAVVLEDFGDIHKSIVLNPFSDSFHHSLLNVKKQDIWILPNVVIITFVDA